MDIEALLVDKTRLEKRLETIESALSDLQVEIVRVDDSIKQMKQARKQMVDKGRRLFALLLEVKSEIARHESLVKQAVDDIADRYIGQREGAYVLNGFVVVRTFVDGKLYTGLVERFSRI